MVLFTTGRGTPMGFPAPTIKISTNSDLAKRKPSWIDFDAGPIAEGSSDFETLADGLFALVLDVASGRQRTRSEINDFREISIWKDGVTL
jgi:altronate hydrolase